MSLATSMPAGPLPSGPLAGRCWRIVEAQSKKSTMKLTDDAAEQHVLETIIEGSKPAVPADCVHLHYLLSTPFRYTPYPSNSRFRRSGSTQGVFYAAEHVNTAVAETVFHRLLFYLESPQTPWPKNPGEYTAFSAAHKVRQAVDLTVAPLNAQRALWTKPDDYTECLALADMVRAQDGDLIRYQSIRDPKAGANLAILKCAAFASVDVGEWQTWHLHFSKTGARGEREFIKLSLEYPPDTFDADPRMKNMMWDR